MSLELSDLDEEVDEEIDNNIRIPISLPEINLVTNEEIGHELSQVTEQRRACNYLFWKIPMVYCCFIIFGLILPTILITLLPKNDSVTTTALIISYCILVWYIACCCPCCIAVVYMYDLRIRQEILIEEVLGNEELTEEAENNLDDKLCSICIEDLQVGDKYTKLECSHSYHRECLKQWIEVKSNCPLCRVAL